MCARQGEGAAGTNLLLLDCGDECLALGIGLYGCSEEGAVVVGNCFDSRYSADEVRPDCCWRNTNFHMGFPAGWLLSIFLWNCLKIGPGGLIVSCRCWLSWSLSEDFSWTFQCCSLSESAFGFGFWNVFEWSIAGRDWLLLLPDLLFILACRRYKSIHWRLSADKI